jgi:GNAT superfamily N-acetyltransferase
MAAPATASTPPPPTSPSPSTPTIYHHSPLHPSPLLALLQPLLPTGLALYRRLQFPLRSGFDFVLATFPPTTTSLPAHFAVAYIDRGRRPEGQAWVLSSLERGRCWAADAAGNEDDWDAGADGAAYTGDAEGAWSGRECLRERGEGYQEEVQQLRALMRAVRLLPYPLAQDEEGYEEASRVMREARRRVGVRRGGEWVEGDDPALQGGGQGGGGGDGRRDFIMFGAVHGDVSRVIRRELGMVPKSGWGIDGVWAAWYRKWFFDVGEVARRVPVTEENRDEQDAGKGGKAESVAAQASAERQPAKPANLGTSGLPAGLYWSNMQEQDLTTVRSRTHIPRRERTLRLLPSICVRRLHSFVHARPPPALADGAAHSSHPVHGREPGEPSMAQTAPIAPDEPVAWAFLGVEASLASLHVEPEFRRLGLAKAVTAKLFSEYMEAFGTREGEQWAHSDVAEDNEASVRVQESLGGRKGHQGWWMSLDLRRV